MVRFLLRIVINIATAALALFICSQIVDDFNIQAKGYVIAVLVFVVAQALLTPLIVNLARKYASAILGGVGLVSTLVSLWVATLVSDSLTITGLSAWILSPLIVWLVTALAGWILVYIIIDRKRSARA